MKNIYRITAAALAVSPLIIAALMFWSQNEVGGGQNYSEKLYVAIEEEGRVGVVDTASRQMIRSIDLSEVLGGRFVGYTTHNVQVAPNGKTVLVTANVKRGMGKQGADDGVSDGLYDKLFFIDPRTDTITGSLSIEVDSHLAHAAVNNAGTFAYVISQEKAALYVVDISLNKIVNTMALGEGSEPHGLRLSSDNTKLYVALIGGRAIAEVDLEDYSWREYPLSGAAIQTAITQDGRYVFGSVYDTKRVAWIDTQTGEQGYIDLPQDAKGSVQLYATPDSKHLYVANQGYYLDQPIGKTVYRINIEQKAVDQIIPAGDAPHGIVVDKAGRFVYVTNLLSEDISVIDTQLHKEVGRIKVGEMPNGISIWHEDLGGTP